MSRLFDIVTEKAIETLAKDSRFAELANKHPEKVVEATHKFIYSMGNLELLLFIGKALDEILAEKESTK